jgi:hypothetical protein
MTMRKRKPHSGLGKTVTFERKATNLYRDLARLSALASDAVEAWEEWKKGNTAPLDPAMRELKREIDA